MKAYLIDPVLCTVTIVEHDGELESVYRTLDVDTIDAVRFAENGDAALVDDEGLLKNPTHFFTIEGYGPPDEPQPIAGRGLVLGVDRRGNSIAPRTPFEDVARRVQFLELLRTPVGIVWLRHKTKF